MQNPSSHASRFIVFPGLWLLGLVVLCATTPRHAWTIGSLEGLATWLAREWRAQRLQHQGLAESKIWSIVAPIVFIVAFCAVIPGPFARDWQPSGEPGEYDVFNGSCAWTRSMVPSHAGTIAALRQVECTGAPIVPPSRDYFVFVHRPDEADDKYNLILSYRESSDDAGWTIAPKLTWATDSWLRIAMAAPTDEFHYQTTMLTDAGGIKVTYAVGKGGVRIRDDYEFQSERGWHIFQ